jgi:tRNA threonylcarbamoyladenosine biosynthesis protein TsaB
MTLGVIKYFPDSQYLFCPMIDARRAEVYCAVYSSKLDEIEPVQAKILESHSFRALFEHNKIVFFGDGASKSESIIESQKNSLFIHGEYPSAKNSCPLVHTKFEEKKFEAIEKFEPFYLKEFVLKKN